MNLQKMQNLGEALDDLNAPQWMAKDIKEMLTSWSNFCKNVPSWNNGGTLSSPAINCTGPGLYRYSCKNTCEVVYYGIANNVRSRVSNGKDVATTMLDTGSARSDKRYYSIEKMVTEDPNLGNWVIEYIPTFHYKIAEYLEAEHVINEQPKYNDEKMVGY